MGECIIKAAKDSDLYMIWSSVVDCPIFMGDRTELMQRPHVTEERVARADLNGSSNLDMRFGFWDDQEFLIREVTPPGPFWWTLQRADLHAYIEACIEAGQMEGGWPFLTPLTDEDEDPDEREA